MWFEKQYTTLCIYRLLPQNHDKLRQTLSKTPKDISFSMTNFTDIG